MVLRAWRSGVTHPADVAGAPADLGHPDRQLRRLVGPQGDLQLVERVLLQAEADVVGVRGDPVGALEDLGVGLQQPAQPALGDARVARSAGVQRDQEARLGARAAPALDPGAHQRRVAVGRELVVDDGPDEIRLVPELEPDRREPGVVLRMGAPEAAARAVAGDGVAHVGAVGGGARSAAGGWASVPTGRVRQQRQHPQVARRRRGEEAVIRLPAPGAASRLDQRPLDLLAQPARAGAADQILLAAHRGAIAQRVGDQAETQDGVGVAAPPPPAPAPATRHSPWPPARPRAAPR